MTEPFVVTGCASGIGFALCHHLAASGASVIGVDVREHAPAGVEMMPVDLTDLDAIMDAAALLPVRLAGVANVAGLPGTHPADRVIAVNVLAARTMIEVTAPRLPPGAAIVNVSSVAAHRSLRSHDDVTELLACPDWSAAQAWAAAAGLSGPDAYDFSKKAVNALTLDAARRWLARGVRCLSVSPGPVETPILGDFTMTMGADRMEAATEIVGRHGRPEEVAAVIAFALGPGATWLNALDIRVDGGLLGARPTKERAHHE